MPGPTVHVDPAPKCKLTEGKHHAPKKDDGGFVIFDATAKCTINFNNDLVFGILTKVLSKGPNQVDVSANPPNGQEVTTRVSIQDCPTQAVGAMQAVRTGPTDIIVP